MRVSSSTQKFWKFTIYLLTSASAAIYLISPRVLAENTCKCDLITCGSCEEERGAPSFYSEPCGGGRVKSCKRPNCVKIDPPPTNCKDSKKNLVKTEDIKEMKIAESMNEIKPTGVVTHVVAKSWIKKSGQDKKELKLGQSIFQGDLIETDENGKVTILFNDKSILSVTPSSRIKIATYESNEDNTLKKALIQLIFGRTRNQVKQKLNGADYRIQTPTAVAGVRGTDFVATYGHSDHATKIETIDGMVELSTHNGQNKLDVPKGKYASYVAKGAVPDVIPDEEIRNFVGDGEFTEIKTLTEKDLVAIRDQTDFSNLSAKKQKNTRPTNEKICMEPEASFNECSWTCMNNPSSIAKCQTEMPNVFCVRKRCNANGEWAEETRLPASHKDNCRGDKIIIAPCNY